MKPRHSFYTHTTTINRPSQEMWDEEGLPVAPTLIYEGECCYQPQSNVMLSSGISQQSPSLYLPLNEAIIEEDDEVEVIADKGRLIKGVVEYVRDYQGVNISGTIVVLKQARGSDGLHEA